MSSRRLHILCVGVVVAILAPSTELIACQCGVVRLSDAYARSELVATGTVRSISPTVLMSEHGQMPGFRICLALDTVWKGPDRGELILEQLNLGSGSCDFPFSRGSSYLVFAERSGEVPHALLASRCSPTRVRRLATEELAMLDQIAGAVHPQTQAVLPRGSVVETLHSSTLAGVILIRQSGNQLLWVFAGVAVFILCAVPLLYGKRRFAILCLMLAIVLVPTVVVLTGYRHLSAEIHRAESA